MAKTEGTRGSTPSARRDKLAITVVQKAKRYLLVDGGDGLRSVMASARRARYRSPPTAVARETVTSYCDQCMGRAHKSIQNAGRDTRSFVVHLPSRTRQLDNAVSLPFDGTEELPLTSVQNGRERRHSVENMVESENIMAATSPTGMKKPLTPSDQVESRSVSRASRTSKSTASGQLSLR